VTAARAGWPEELPKRRVRPTMTEDVPRARADLEGLSAAGVDLDRVCRQLQEEGVESFSDSFESLLAALEARRVKLAASARD
jgi:transaldolase